VSRWFHGPLTPEETRDKYLPRIRGEEPTHGFIVSLDGTPVGFVQRYRVGDEPGLGELLGVSEEAHGIDIFIGEGALLGRGLGARILREFSDVMLADPAVELVIIDPDTENIAAIRAYARAGFRALHETLDTLDPQRRCLLMERRRDG
jgi:RimJ/RimL family protein N-acetyltransferase